MLKVRLARKLVKVFEKVEYFSEKADFAYFEGRWAEGESLADRREAYAQAARNLLAILNDFA